MEPSPSDRDASTARTRPDLDFARDPFPTPALPRGVSPADYQRLVINPFLALAWLLGCCWSIQRLIASPMAPLALIPTVLLGSMPVLIHFHCLDCGRTGIYPRWWRHVCPGILARAHRNRAGWFRWPRARTQLILWCYILGPVALLIVVLGVGAWLARWG